MSVLNKESAGVQIERQLRGVFILIVFLWLLGIIFVAKKVTMNDVYFVFSLISLWGFFEFVISITKAAERLEKAKSYSEFFEAFFSLLWILITQDLKNRISNILKKIIHRS